jgi:hypothetical protein
MMRGTHFGLLGSSGLNMTQVSEEINMSSTGGANDKKKLSDISPTYLKGE